MSKSGEKFQTHTGFSAIKDGVKARSDPEPSGRKPPWLRVRIPSGGKFAEVSGTVHRHRLSTVCEESHCPNIGECWNAGTATIMLMGSVCTRACRFCSVDTGNPNGWLDPEEPENAAESVRLMGLKYVVVTSVDRDDLADGGAGHYAASIRAIKHVNPGTGVEALTPDFSGSEVRHRVGGDGRTGCLRTESRDGGASDPSGQGSTRRLPADPGRARRRKADRTGHSHQIEPDAGPRRDGSRRSNRPWTISGLTK